MDASREEAAEKTGSLQKVHEDSAGRRAPSVLATCGFGTRDVRARGGK